MKNQYGRLSFFNKFLPRPDESYEFWNTYLGNEFSKSFSPRSDYDSNQIERLRSALYRTAFYQDRRILSAKMTGPARIEFLSAMFPDALFVHVIRDGMSVVHSLLNVGFWKDGGGLVRPWWKGGLGEEDLSIWARSENNSAVLAALQWKRIVQNARKEAGNLKVGRYHEFRYEELVRDPSALITKILDVAELKPSIAVESYLRDSLRILDRGQRYLKMNSRDIDLAVSAMQPIYGELGYSI